MKTALKDLMVGAALVLLAVLGLGSSWLLWVELSGFWAGLTFPFVLAPTLFLLWAIGYWVRRCAKE